MTNFEEDVFRKLCYLSQNWHGVEVFSARNIAELLNVSPYNVRKALHALRDYGIVENACMGRPAQVSCGEYTELICEASPPIRGFSVTAKGTNTDIWKSEVDLYNKSFEDWANGAFQKGNGNEQDKN